jgi:Stress responsive A/B Barrel Domain
LSLVRRSENVREPADLPEIRGSKKAMKWFRTNNRVRLGAGATLAICLFLPGCGTMPSPAPAVTQVVLIWMKHPDRSADRAKLRRAADSLRMMPGVLRVEAGRTVPALPPGLDRNFDLGVVITFRDQAALQRYEKDPRHLEAMRRYLRPLVRRYEVYNFSSR